MELIQYSVKGGIMTSIYYCPIGKVFHPDSQIRCNCGGHPVIALSNGDQLCNSCGLQARRLITMSMNEGEVKKALSISTIIDINKGG